MNIKHIKNEVSKILSNYDFTLPISIEKIVKDLSIVLKSYPFEDNISGVLSIENNKPVIIYNNLQSKLRRRFTIAHELGHYILHQKTGKIFIDSNIKLYRSENSRSTPEKALLEREANFFAATILMPEDLVKQKYNELDKTCSDEDELMSLLSNEFQVSQAAMSFRLKDIFNDN